MLFSKPVNSDSEYAAHNNKNNWKLVTAFKKGNTISLATINTCLMHRNRETKYLLENYGNVSGWLGHPIFKEQSRYN